MKDLGAAKKILGMEIFIDREKELFLSQKAYINEVLTRFVMSSGEPISTLCTANDHLTMYMGYPVGASGPLGHLVRKDIWPVGASGPLGHLARWGVWSVGTSGPLGHPVRWDIRLMTNVWL